MAASPSHQFGQIIGNLLEMAVAPLLLQCANDHGVYYDKKGARPARKGTTLTWTDANNNKHDLDCVFERGGTDQRTGTPVAFIEIAWRRYTKHSRNKVQEIQGAIEPLAETYRNARPFKGAILAGEFTPQSLEQLKSLGFTVLYFHYDTVVNAFREVHIDASSEENTPDIKYAKKVRKWNALTEHRRQVVAESLIVQNKAGLDEFFHALHVALTRTIRSVTVIPLHGAAAELSSIEEAVGFIQAYNELTPGVLVFHVYEIKIQYGNGDQINASFGDKVGATEFLRSYTP